MRTLNVAMAGLAAFAFCATLGVDAASARTKRQKTDEAGQAEPEGKKATEYESPFPFRMNWVLATINGKAPPAELYFSVDENLRGSGSTGCNSWSGSVYPIKGQRLALVAAPAMTKKACAAPVMMLERQFIGLLATGPKWTQQGSTLTLTGKAGTMVFNRGL